MQRTSEPRAKVARLHESIMTNDRSINRAYMVRRGGGKVHRGRTSPRRVPASVIGKTQTVYESMRWRSKQAMSVPGERKIEQFAHRSRRLVGSRRNHASELADGKRS